MSRLSAALLLVLTASACGGPDLPESVPPVQLDGGALPDGGELPDGGPVEQDAGPSVDAGQAFFAACAAAGCGDADAARCEPLDDGGALCGAVCGAHCDALCAPSRCRDLDAGTWDTAYCTNALPDGGLGWSRSANCDDGNACTSGDACGGGTCAGTARSCPQSQCHPGTCNPSTGACDVSTSGSCDDGNVCTTGDHCNASGSCVGAAAGSLHDRFYNSTDTYAYDVPGGWNYSGWTDNGSIYASAPGGAAIHQFWNSGEVDRTLSLAASVSGYAIDIDEGTGYDHSVAGTVPLLVSTFTSGGHTRHYFYTSGHGSPPSSGSNSGIWVCPVP